MARLIAGIITYNEEQLLAQCLESIVNKVDEIVLVDGRIAPFPGIGASSTDNTVAIARDYGAEVITSDTPYPCEADMRSKYLVGEDGDWYLLIDADEKCMTALPNIADLPSGIDAYSVHVRMIGAPTNVWRPRLFRHSGTMEYRAIHDALFSNETLISRPEDATQLHSVWFAHYQMARSENRRNQKRLYYQTGYTHEPQYRKEWRMFNHG